MPDGRQKCSVHALIRVSKLTMSFLSPPAFPAHVSCKPPPQPHSALPVWVPAQSWQSGQTLCSREFGSRAQYHQTSDCRARLKASHNIVLKGKHWKQLIGARAAHWSLQSKRWAAEWHSAQWTEAACQAPSDKKSWRHAMRCSLHTAGGNARGLQELSSQSLSAAQSQHRLVWRQPSLSLGAWQPASQRSPLRSCCASCLECAPACMMRKGAGRRHTCGRTHHRRAGRLLEVAWLVVVAIRREDRGVLRCL